MASNAPAYPVYRSPDGKREQIAPNPAREVKLRFDGWTKVTQPRKRTTTTTEKAADAPKPNQAKG
jgi:hypothetical protein